jgi:tetratricopeptide (TPR) repeat protein
MVSGQTPFSGETALSVAIKHKSERPKEPKELNEQIPEDLNQLILKCLEKDKQKRYQNVKELLNELKNIEEGIPTTERVMPKGRPFTSKEITVKFSIKKILAVASLVILAGLIGLAIWKLIPLIREGPEVSLSGPEGTENLALKKSDPFAVGERLMEENKQEEALVQFQKAVSENPSHILARIKIAEILHNQKRTEEALAEYRKVIETDPSDPRPYAKLGEIYEQKNDLMEARSFYQKYLETAPQNDQYNQIKEHMKKLESRIRAEQPEEQKEAEPLSKGVQKTEASEEQAVMVQETSKPEEITQIKQKIGPEEKKNKQIIKKSELEKKEKEKEPQKSDLENQQKTDKASSSDDADKNKEKSLVSDKVDAGIQEFEKENYEQAVSLMEEVLEMVPEHPEAQEYLGLSQQKLAEQNIHDMVNDYAESLQNSTLVDFYKNNCTPEFYPEVKQDAEWLLRSYRDLKCFVSNVSVQFNEENSAEADISLIITGTSQRDGIKQALFEGIYRWHMIKQNGVWKIRKVSSQSSKKEID